MRRSLAALTFLLGGCGRALENPPPDAHTPLADASPDSSLGFAASPLSLHFGKTFDTKRNMRL
jgi:hypothetical protein